MAKHVIHAVGPIYSASPDDAQKLASAYRSSLALAVENNVSSIAFPCISTGVYGYPQAEACEIAITTVVAWLRESQLPAQITFCCFLDADYERYRARLLEVVE